MKNRTVGNTKINRTEPIYEGESIEQMMRRALNNNEPIGNEVGLIYTEKNEGVMPAYNIRTDRFEVALDGIDALQKSYTAKRAEAIKTEEKIDGVEPTQGTENQ